MSKFLALCRHGWALGGWRCALSGLPLALIALGAALVYAGHAGLPFLPRATIGQLMRVEAYVFSTGFFYSFFLAFAGPFLLADALRRWSPAFALAGLLAIVALMSWLLSTSTREPVIFLQFYALIAVSYLGIFLGARRAQAIIAWYARTGWMIVCFFVVVPLVRPPMMVDSWRTQQSVMLVAALYFALLAAAEWSGFYHGVQGHGLPGRKGENRAQRPQ